MLRVDSNPQCPSAYDLDLLPTLETDRLVIRPIAADDIDALHALFKDPFVRRHLWDDAVVERDVVAEIVRQSALAFEEHDAGLFGIELHDRSKSTIGFAGYRYEPSGDFEYLYALSPNHLGRGLMSEATRAILDYGFSQAGIERVVFRMDVANTEAIRLVQRFGARLQEWDELSPLPTAVYFFDRRDFQHSERRWSSSPDEELDSSLRTTFPTAEGVRGVLDPHRRGDQVGRYRIDVLLRRDPILAQYRATDPLLDRKVTLCAYVQSDIGDIAQGARLLEREANLIASLSHPALVPILDGGTQDGRSYFVYESMPHTLAGELLRSGRLEWPRCIAIACRLASALDLLHRRGFVHRDVKPENVLLNQYGEACLGGLLIANQAHQLPMFRALTPHYAPPELVRDGVRDEVLETLKVSPAYDIWSLGTVLYETLVGNRPYKLRDLRDAFGGTLRPPTPASTVIPGVPLELDGVLGRCLAQRPEDRYSTCAEMIDALDGISITRKEPETRIFISHASHDREYVESHIVQPLEQSGFKTWYSRVSVQTAAEWERSILRGLESSDWFVLAMSPQSLRSEWVKDELFWAIDHRPDHIIPVLIEPCSATEFHIRLRRIHAIDLVDDVAEGSSKLISLVRESLNSGYGDRKDT